MLSNEINHNDMLSVEISDKNIPTANLTDTLRFSLNKADITTKFPRISAAAE